MDNAQPISRISKFFSQDDFDLNLAMGQEYLHGDINFKLYLYRVETTQSESSNIYAEAGTDQIRYKPMVEFNALVKHDLPTNTDYGKGVMRFNEPGNMILSVYKHHLEELKVDIIYGDYIGYPEDENKIRYYNVVNDGKVTTDGGHTMFGFRSHYRTIICSPVQESEFRGL